MAGCLYLHDLVVLKFPDDKPLNLIRPGTKQISCTLCEHVLLLTAVSRGSHRTHLLYSCREKHQGLRILSLPNKIWAPASWATYIM